MSQVVKSRLKESKPTTSATAVEEDPSGYSPSSEEPEDIMLATRSKIATRIRGGTPAKMIMISFLLVIFLLFLYHSSSSSSNSWLVAKQQTDVAVIPECEKHPWKSREDLVGECGGALKPHEILNATLIKIINNKDSISDDQSRIEACASECCASEDCVTWQYRRDVGCVHGGDVRLGMEKDGPGDWCHHHPPKRWNGQYIVRKGDRNADACSSTGWNQNEQPGQCFGLGDVRKGIDSSVRCREACCSDAMCGAWQFHPDLGCFYNTDMYGCIDVASDPVLLESFVGRRKRLSDRKYTDDQDQPWSQQL